MDATLDKVRGQSSNALPHIQRPALLLQAIDSTLAESSTAPSPTAYFASLLATLSQVTKVQGEKRDDQLISAALYLLGIVSPYTPSNVLATQHDALLSLLSTCLSISKTEQANLKSILGIQAHLLDVYPSKHLQRLDATALYNSLLPLLADSRPKLRKKAHDTIRVVFEKEQHPYLDRTAEWITLALEAGYKDAKRNPDDATRLIGLLVFVQSVVAHWPKEVSYAREYLLGALIG